MRVHRGQRRISLNFSDFHRIPLNFFELFSTPSLSLLALLASLASLGTTEPQRREDRHRNTNANERIPRSRQEQHDFRPRQDRHRHTNANERIPRSRQGQNDLRHKRIPRSSTRKLFFTSRLHLLSNFVRVSGWPVLCYK